MGEGAEPTAETAEIPWQGPVADPQHARDPRRVREINTPTSGVSDMSECGSADGTAEATAVTPGDRSRPDRGLGSRLVARLVARLHPPDIWGDRPGLATLAAYARYGAGAPAGGPLRTGQIWWFRLVCLPITAWAYWKAWALERPWRGAPVLLLQAGWWLLNIVTLLRLL